MTNKHFALIGFLSIVVFWSTYFIMSLNRDDYSFLTKAISELGSVDAPNKWLWNLFGYIIPGIFTSIFCYGLVKNLANYGRYKLPLVGLVLSGLLMSFSGAFPGDFDNKRSMTMLMHNVGSFGSYIFFLLGAFTIPSLLRKSNYWEKTVLAGQIMVWMTIAFGAWSFIVPGYPAVGQRLVFAFYFLWIALHSFKLYNDPHQNNNFAQNKV